MKVYLALTALILSSPVNAGVLESLSEASAWTHSFWSKACPESYDEVSAKAILAPNVACAHSNGFPKVIQVGLRDFLEKNQTTAEDDLFTTLARTQSENLECSAKFAHSLGSPNDEAMESTAELLTAVREAKKMVVAAAGEHNAQKLAACPLTIDELKPTPKEMLQGQPDNYFTNCDTLIRARVQYYALASSVPLIELPDVAKLVDTVANEPADSNAESIKTRLAQVYQTGAVYLRQQSKVWAGRAASAPNSLDRQIRYDLLQDPDLVDTVLSRTGQSQQIKSLACHADARFHRGADALSANVMVGSMALGAVGGLAIKATAAALKVSRMALAAREAGLITNSTTKLIRAAAFASGEGMRLLGSYPKILNACSSDGPTAEVLASSSSCRSTPTLSQIKHQRCIVAAMIALLGTKSINGRVISTLPAKLLVPASAVAAPK